MPHCPLPDHHGTAWAPVCLGNTHCRMEVLGTVFIMAHDGTRHHGIMLASCQMSVPAHCFRKKRHKARIR